MDEQCLLHFSGSPRQCACNAADEMQVSEFYLTTDTVSYEIDVRLQLLKEGNRLITNLLLQFIKM